MLAPRPLAGFKGPTSKGRGNGKERGRGKAERGRGHPRFLPGLTRLAVADNACALRKFLISCVGFFCNSVGHTH